jgi:uncharacterized protein
MTHLQLHDRTTAQGTRLTRDGYLVAEVRAARTGVYEYVGAELGRPDLGTVRVYRPPEEVFAQDALESFTSLPVTVDHPPEMVSAKNWKKYARGYTGEDVTKDDIYVRVPLILKDARAIEVVQSGRNELSFGYTCDVEFTPGQTPSGESYDAVQRNPRGNHLAIVSAGRAGRDCRIGDADDDNTGDRDMPAEIKTKTVTVDGIPVEATDASAQVITTLSQRAADRIAENLQLQATHKAALDAKDAEIARLTQAVAEKDKQLGTKDAELKLLSDAAADASRIDQLVADRVDVLTGAQALGLSDADAKGKSNSDVVRQAVQKALGDAYVTGKDDGYVRAAFDLVRSRVLDSDQPLGAQGGAKVDPIRTTLGQGLPASIGDAARAAQDAHRAMCERTQNAWKNPVPRQ